MPRWLGNGVSAPNTVAHTVPPKSREITTMPPACPDDFAQSYPLIQSGQMNPTVNRMLSKDLDQLAALVPQYLHRGEFELTSGGTVAWYIDGRELLLNDTGIKIAGRILNHVLLPETEVVAGPATAGIITVSAVLQAADRKLLGCYVRDDSKGHGLQKQISGSSVAGRKVAIVDDTCSSGHSLLKCAETVRQHGGDVVQVIALFDRDAGGNAIKAAGYRYDYALRVSEDGSCQPQAE